MKRIFLICALGTALFAMIADAVPTNITVDSTGQPLNGSGVANEAQYNQSNNNPTSNLLFLNQEISLWNLSNPPPDLLPAVPPVALNHESIGDTQSYNAVAGYDYVVFHFGAGQAGGGGVSRGGWWQAWFLDGLGGVFTVPSVGGEPVGGFSSARYYNPHGNNNVPDGGTTAILLGAALGVFGMVRYKFGVV